MTDRDPSISRRDLLRVSGLAGGAVLGGAAWSRLAAGASAVPAGPALVRSGRPMLTHGVQCGDVSAEGALVWARADRSSRMIVEVSPEASFRRVRRISGPSLTEDTDFTGKVRLAALSPGNEWYYRVSAEDPDGRVAGEPLTGTFRTAPQRSTEVRLQWSGDVVGQGWVSIRTSVG
jgi:alkaline phosphatase D